MKFIRLLINSVLFCLTISINAQEKKPETAGKTTTSNGTDKPRIGKISGTIYDAATKTPIEYATISIMSKKDSSLVGGGVTNAKGKFNIDEIPFGRYFLRISFIGYQNLYVDSIFISPQKFQYNLDNLQLKTASENLKEVNVVAENKLFENKIDRKVFNVEKSIVTQGGTAADILEKIPSISVDMDGNISMRGNSNVTILIDGKPSSLAANKNAILQSIPASSIDNIEVITNPSSKYDPDGLTGIINIVLKKSLLQGFNGTAGGSTGYPERYNANLNLNLRTKFFNIFSDYGFNNRYKNESGKGTRWTNFNNISQYLEQEGTNYDKKISHTAKFGIDFYLSPKTTLTLSSTLNTGKGVEEGTMYYNSLNSEKVSLLKYDRYSREEEDNFGLDYNLNFRQNFAKPKQELTADLTFSKSDYNTEANYIEKYNNSQHLPSLQQTSTKPDFKIFTAQADYVHPFTETRRLDFGIKASINDVRSAFVSESYDHQWGSYVNDANLTNTFLYKEQQNSAYVQYADQLGNFGIQLGTRFEQSRRETELLQNAQKNTKDYLNLFPSAHLLYKLPANHEVSLSYTRRINRPSMRSLNPFTDYSDPRNLRAGNPNLDPEYINSYEIAHAKYWNKSSVTTTVFYREINNLIRRFRRFVSADTSIITFENLNGGRNFGGEVVVAATLTGWWDFNGSIEFYRTQLDAGNLESDLNSEGYNFSTKATTNFKLPKDFVLQLSGNYSAPEVMPQGERGAMYAMDAGVKKDILNKRGSLSFRVSDLFDTRKFMMDMRGDNFTQHMERRWESRQFTLSFTYRFGKLVKSMQPRKKERRESDGGGEDMF